jgi:hypothetical protein
MMSTIEGLRALCEVKVDGGSLVGTEKARLFFVPDGGKPETVQSFDSIPTRDQWYTPWGGPPDVRSVTVTPAGTVLVNVHVGGVWRGRLDGPTWDEVVAVDDDTHQVLAATSAPGVVVVAAAVGFGWSRDDGQTFKWTTAGLHATYCRAVAVAGDWVLVSASNGPFTKDGRLYRRLLAADGQEPFERCINGLPDVMPSNIDTHQLVADGDTVTVHLEDGREFRSLDAGATWSAA